MKLTLRLAALLAAAPLLAAAAATPSQITAATVYLDRAVVTRTAVLELAAPGDAEATFDSLPAMLLDQSVQVDGRGTADATLLEVAVRSHYLEFTASDRVKSLEDELRTVNRQDRTLSDRATILNQQRDYILKIQTATATPAKDTPAPAGVETWTKLLAFTDDQLGKFAAELQTLDAQREELQARRTALEQALNELRGQEGRSFKTVAVRLHAATAGRLELTLRYTVPDASWTPSYDARVAANDRAVQLGYFGLVRQNTGEDWKDIELTLSTARPALGGAAPELSPWIVQQREVVPVQAPEGAVTLAPFAMRAESMAKTKAAQILAARSREELRDAAVATATVEAQVTSATFRLPGKASVPADNAAHKLGVAAIALKADLDYEAAPKLLPAAFLTARVTNSSDYPILPGAMNVFLDGTFVAASSLRGVMPGEKFDLALGADEGLTVRRKLNNRLTEDTGLVNKGRRLTYDFTLTVQNNKPATVKLVLIDQLPVSRHEKIVVKQLAPDEREVKPASDGTLKWNLSLKPGEKRELPLKFTIEYPNDLPVIGIE